MRESASSNSHKHRRKQISEQGCGAYFWIRQSTIVINRIALPGVISSILSFLFTLLLSAMQMIGSLRLGNLSQQRRPSSSYFGSVKSICSLHTETINVWSHIIGTVLFSADAVRFTAICTGPLARDEMVILIYLATTAFCFLCSVLYHVFSNHDQAHFWQRIDHLGIVAVIWASAISVTFFSFICESDIQGAYMGILSLFAIISLLSHWHASSRSVGICWDRVATHVAFGGSAALPALHFSYRSHQHASEPEFRLVRSFWSLVVFNSTGGLIYATDLIQRVVRARVNTQNASHQVMHVVVVFGAWTYRQGLFSLYQLKTTRDGNYCV